jgi:hypothetical protein
MAKKIMKSKMQDLWLGWKRAAHRIGDAQARFILTVFYFLILAPFALVVRLWSDPLRLRSSAGWLRRPAEAEDPARRAREQY